MSFSASEEMADVVRRHPLMMIMHFYGPYAFSFILLIALWTTIVGPLLEKNQLNVQAQQEVVDSMRIVTSQQQEVSRALEKTVATLEHLLTRVNTN
jgi:hypothetical protein